MANSKVEICNMALNEMSIDETVENIDIPQTSKEKSFAQIYDTVRQIALKEMMPNFALARDLLAELPDKPAFGYGKAYQYPKNCLKFLGVGNIEEKDEVRYNVESVNGKLCITTDYEYGALPARYIEDVKDETRFDAMFELYLALELASRLALKLTQNQGVKDRIDAALVEHKMSLGAMNAQENPPIRVSRSKWKAARYGGTTNVNRKK